MSSGSKNFFKNILGTIVRQALSGILTLLTTIIAARTLGPAGSGSYAVALLLPTLLTTFLNVGVNAANVFHLASRKISLPIASLATLFAFAASCSAGMLIGGLVSHFFGTVFFPSVPLEVLYWALASFPFMLLLQYIGGILQGVQDFRSFNLTLVLPPLVTFVACVTLVASGLFDLRTLTMSYLGGQVVGAAIGLCIVSARHEWRTWNWASSGSQAFSYCRPMLTYGLKAYASNAVTFVNYRVDLFLVNFYVGAAATGMYVLAMQFAERVWLFSQAVGTVFLPRISALAGDENERKRLTPLISRWTFWLTLASALVLAALFPLIVLGFVGEAFAPATGIMVLLLPGVIAWAPARVLANYLAGRGMPETNLRIALIVMLFNVLGNLVLCPLLGVAGAAIATTMAYCLMLALTTKAYSQESGVQPGSTLVNGTKGDLQKIVGMLRKRL